MSFGRRRSVELTRHSPDCRTFEGDFRSFEVRYDELGGRLTMLAAKL